MHLLQVAAAVLNQTPLAWDANRAHILDAIGEARRRDVSILCLPELCITGYGCEDAFLSANTRRMAWQVLQEILPATGGMIVSLGLPLLHNNVLYNTACLIVDGQIAGFTAKRFLAGDGIHYEPRWFKPWPAERRAMATVDGVDYPLGDIYYDCGGVRIGFEICEDAWVANRPGSGLSLGGVDIILNPSASHFAFGKDDVRERFVLEGSRAFGVSYVYTNLLGNEAGRAIYDGGAMIASAGRMVAIGPRFSFADVALTSATVDLDATRLSRAASGSYMPALDDEPGNCVRVPFVFPKREPVVQNVSRADWERGPRVKEEEFTRALCLALFDYLRKSRSHGFVVSLSGGADSATVACLVGMMVELGVKELGLDGFLQKLGYLTRIQAARDPREIVRGLLSCVYQSTRHSTEVTRSAARAVADAVGAEFLELDVEAIVQQYIALVSNAIGRDLAWDSDDLALQNIQARARAPGVWLLANLRGALLLATSNRSEAAVGYATMDGDTAGGLSPIAGIDKAFIRRWLVWLENEGPEGLQPIPALRAVNDQAPTAELRPQHYCQTDEADLMPYDLLDAIERAAIRDKHSPLEVYKLVRAEFPHYGAADLGVWVERFFRLWCRNQWKRERYAPSFHLDDENLDPKTWCRFPILSGGFDRELADLPRLHPAHISITLAVSRHDHHHTTPTTTYAAPPLAVSRHNANHHTRHPSACGLTMIAGYHLIWTAYGWWLPNDPRGSRSYEIRCAAIESLGELHYGPARIQPAGHVIREFYDAAAGVLKYPLVKFTPEEVAAIAESFARVIRDRGYTCYGCAIMPEHIHVLIRKHRDQAQTMIEALQEASRAAVLAKPQAARGADHPVWGGPGWKVYLETPEDMWRTESYIQRNPPEAGLPEQRWPFVQVYDGWLPGQVRIVKRARRPP